MPQDGLHRDGDRLVQTGAVSRLWSAHILVDDELARALHGREGAVRGYESARNREECSCWLLVLLSSAYLCGSWRQEPRFRFCLASGRHSDTAAEKAESSILSSSRHRAES